MPENAEEVIEIPPMVTFTSGAELLVKLGIVESMTREGVRRVAKTDPNWPFGPDRPHKYGKVANAQSMATEPFLEFFRARQVKKRGPDKQPRKPKGARPEKPPTADQ
ncbi:hypothetical protein ACIQGZ_17095 [Streptomyces sp. NPDC092296]|uniref:hypothetical protein n=1 Tax=Streptomyces sp. NPDC092296 TaxID=3366012 RepID=UPI003810991D